MNWLSQQMLPLFFTMNGSQKNRRAFWFWAFILLIAGALLWGKFLNWGLGPYQYHDWEGITIPRLTFLRDAVRQGVLPIHIQDPYPLGEITDRYLSIPDAFLSPQMILLRWMEVGPFVLVNFLLLYAVGWAGLVWISLKKQLSPLAFSVLFLLFNYNGHMLAHVSVGHYTWVAYFLFPWLIGLVLDLFDGEASRDWALKVTVLLFVMLLQGGYHPFIWSLFLLALLIPAVPRYTRTLVLTLVFSVLVSAVRTLPPVLNLGMFDNKFIAGYPFFQTIWDSLINVYLPNDYTDNLFLAGQIGTWEYALYIGIFATLLVGWFGLVRVYRGRQENGSYAGLLLPVIGLTLLSLNDIYYFLRSTVPLPLFTGERVASRMIILAFLLLLVLAVIELQKWLNSQPPTLTFALSSIGVIILIGNDLWQNFHLWRIPAAAEKYKRFPDDPARWAVANHPDPLYIHLLLIGSAVTLLAFVALVCISYHSHPQPSNKWARFWRKIPVFLPGIHHF